VWIFFLILKLSKIGSMALDNVDIAEPSRMDKTQTKLLKKWLKTTDLLTIIEIIAENIKAFKQVYSKGALELCGKIYLTNQDSYGRASPDKSMEIKISVTEFQSKDSIILVISDITQRDMISRLEGVNDYKINLLASFSHELRTPLNANLNLLETAIDHKEMSNELRKSYILPALRSAKLLFYIISDILDYSQMSLNKISVKVTNFSLRNLIYQIADLFRMQATQKGLKLNVKLNEEGEITNDPARISQILVTLVSNAVKFTYTGSITIQTIRQENSIVISVSDSGIGIHDKGANKLQQILQGSDKLEKITDESTGCNLGLTVASKLAFLISPNKATGLSFHRHASGGTTFYFKVEDRKLQNQRSLIDMSLSVNTIIRSNTERGDEFTRQRTVQTNSIIGGVLNEGTMLTLPEEGIADFIENIDYDGGGMFKNALKPVQKVDTNVDTRKTNSTAMSQRTTEKEVSYKDVLKYTYSKQRSMFAGNGNCKCDEILVVDDDPFNILAAQKLMEAQGIKSMCAYHGKQAIEIIENKKRCGDTCRIFRMILMDCNMPVMDGYECTKYLKAKMETEELPKIPIIACTSFVTHFDAQACFNCGMDDYTTKPLSKEKFMSICYKWIKKRSLPE
jgi:signal transduction histidine kinase